MGEGEELVARPAGPKDINRHKHTQGTNSVDFLFKLNKHTLRCRALYDFFLYGFSIHTSEL